MCKLNIEPLGSAFGAQITGCDLASGIDAITFPALAQALYDNRVIVIREQRLSKPEYLRFGEMWGEPIPHVLDHMRMQGYPQMMTVGNTELRDRDPLIRNGAALWHTDQSYERVPASATMLYSIIAPMRGGETQFCDMRSAYEALDETIRERIGALRVAHKYGAGKRGPDEPPVNPIINAQQDQRVPVTWHPLVMAHPVTGTRALYALGHGAHASVRFEVAHKYGAGKRGSDEPPVNPIIIASNERDSRLLWRISVRGQPSALPAARQINTAKP